MRHPAKWSAQWAHFAEEALRLQCHGMVSLAGGENADPVPPHQDNRRFEDPVWENEVQWDLLKEWYLLKKWYLLGVPNIEDALYITPGLDTLQRERAACWWRNWLGAALRATDTAARFGGDEFAVLLEDVEDRATARSVAENLRAMVEKPIPFAGRHFEVGVSIGLKLYPADGESAALLLAAADEVMYAEKAERHAAAASGLT